MSKIDYPRMERSDRYSEALRGYRRGKYPKPRGWLRPGFKHIGRLDTPQRRVVAPRHDEGT